MSLETNKILSGLSSDEIKKLVTTKLKEEIRKPVVWNNYTFVPAKYPENFEFITWYCDELKWSLMFDYNAKLWHCISKYASIKSDKCGHALDYTLKVELKAQKDIIAEAEVKYNKLLKIIQDRFGI